MKKVLRFLFFSSVLFRSRLLWVLCLCKEDGCFLPGFGENGISSSLARLARVLLGVWALLDVVMFVVVATGIVRAADEVKVVML